MTTAEDSKGPPDPGTTGDPGIKADRVLCDLDEIEDGEAKGFVLDDGQGANSLFVVREDREVYGYVNACPHMGTPLDCQPDGFVSPDGGYILCSTHGALFEIEDGFCVSGPCAGASLEPVKVALDADDRVVLRRS